MPLRGKLIRRLSEMRRALQVLHNVCQDVKWEALGSKGSEIAWHCDVAQGIDFRLRKYEQFFREPGPSSATACKCLG